MAFEEEGQAVKGGTCWVDMSIERGIRKNSKGLVIWIKADERIEEFMKNLSGGETESSLLFGRMWHPIKPNKELKAYKVPKAHLTDNPAISFHSLGGDFRSLTDGSLNLSFLRLVGISSPEGVHFEFSRAASSIYAKSILSDLTRHIVQFVKEYISPLAISLRITSQDLS